MLLQDSSLSWAALSHRCSIHFQLSARNTYWAREKREPVLGYLLYSFTWRARLYIHQGKRKEGTVFQTPLLAGQIGMNKTTFYLKACLTNDQLPLISHWNIQEDFKRKIKCNKYKTERHPDTCQVLGVSSTKCIIHKTEITVSAMSQFLWHKREDESS